jgi:CDP-diacylglycerol--serine O-phosphatidyltransferase
MDPVLPRLEQEGRRRRRRLIFRHRQIPLRMLVPNFFTLLGLCAGLTAIRLAIETRFELAIVAIALAALLDGVDGRVARMLKASSRFGAELDSLADFVNFGVAPAVLIFTWGLQDARSIGWIVVMVFALASALRLARFNAAIDEEKPRWQANYFTGMPAPAAAVVALLPLYLEQIGASALPRGVLTTFTLLYTLLIAGLMVSTIPTFSGKLMGERIRREWVLPLFILVIAVVALLVTYPYPTLTGLTIAYLATIPLSVRRFSQRLDETEGLTAAKPAGEPEKSVSGAHGGDATVSGTRH